MAGERNVSVPDWLPWWGQLLILVTGILILLAFAMMPFSVFGIRARLEAMEERLDDIQAEIRALSLRLPDPGRRPPAEEIPLAARPAADRAMDRAGTERTIPERAGPERAVFERPAAERAYERPPIPPAAWQPDSGPRRPIGTPKTAEPRRADGESRRIEPELPRAGTPRQEPRVSRFW